MSKFVGRLCPVCRERFCDNDETVVCPVCGTPHHRACYLARNKCALEDLHGSFTWAGKLPEELASSEQLSRPANDPEPAGESSSDTSELQRNREELERLLRMKEELLSRTGKTVSREASETSDNELDEQVLHEVEAMLGLSPGYRDDPVISECYLALISGLLDPQPGVDGVSQRELTFFSAFSVNHFLRAFTPFRSGVKKTGFNLASGLLMPINQFFRRMDGLAFALLGLIALVEGLPLILNVQGMISAQLTGWLLVGGRIVLGAAAILMCVFGDYIYYRHAVNRIRKVRRQFEGKTQTLDYFLALYDSGRPSLVKGAVGILALAFFRVLFNVVLI